MKSHFVKILILYIVVSFFLGCQQSPTESYKNSNNVRFKQNIEELNSKYREYGFKETPNKRMQSNYYNEYIDFPYTSDAKVDGWEVAYYDLLGVIQGGYVGAAFGGYGALIGAVVASTVLSVTSFVAQNNGFCEILTSNDNLDAGGPFSAIKITDVDIRQPVVSLEEMTQIEEHECIGECIGQLHNNIIYEFMGNPNYCNVNVLNSSQRLTYTLGNIYETNVQLGIDEREIFNNVLYELANYYYETTEIESLDEYFENEIASLNEYYEIAINLDSSLFFNYSNEYMLIIDSAYQSGIISYEDAIKINGAISVLCHSKLLWNNYLPDFDYSSIRMAIDSVDNLIVYCNNLELSSILNQMSVKYVGVPHFVNGKLAEVYFFNKIQRDNNLTNIDVPISLSFINENTNFMIYNGAISSNWDYVIQHDLFSFDSVPDMNGEVFFLKNY